MPEVIEKTGPFPAGAVQKFCRTLDWMFDPRPEFMLPGLVPTCASLSSARSFSDKPMSLNAFNSALWTQTAFAEPSATPRVAPFTSYSLRRLGPTIAASAFLLPHEVLPFGNWKADGLSDVEKEAARKAQMPLLYADTDTKATIEVAVKTAVWCLIDRLPTMCRDGDLSRCSWSQLSDPLRRAMAEWRGLTPDVQKWAPEPAAPSKGKAKAAESSSSSSSSSSQASADEAGQNPDEEPPDSEPDWDLLEPPAALGLAEWVVGSRRSARVHFLLLDGSRPKCAGAKSKSELPGFGLLDLRNSGHAVCSHCCTRVGITPEALEAIPLAALA